MLLIGLAAPGAAAFTCRDLVRSAAEPESAGYDRGLLWRIESRDGRVSHLFGTIHISDPRVTDLPRSVTEALAGSDSFGMEVLLDVDAMLEMSRAMYYDSGESLEDAVDPELFDSAVELLAHYGVTAQAARHLKPWAAYTTLSLPPGKVAMPLDMLLLTAARERGKETFGLERIDEQVAVFEELTLSDQRALLAEAVCHYAEFQAELETLISHYVARDLIAMMRMSMRYKSALHDRFMDALLWQRNRRMSERMVPYLRRGGAFIAIGVLHLPGPGGVLDLLHRRGYGITQVY